MGRSDFGTQPKILISIVTAHSHFKGWAKPGPVPPGLEATGASDPPIIEPHETLDAVSGHFRIFQLRDGHRFSTDDLLVAWYGTSWCATARTALDLGSGIGTVGMICAWRLPGARFVTIEAQPESVALARKSARYNGLVDRYEICEGDFRQPEILCDGEKFDLITGSPPYFPTDAGIKSDHPQRLACRFELRGNIADYCATAAKSLALGGFFACVFPTEPSQLARIETAAAESKLVIVRKRPVIFREGERPLVTLFGMTRAEDLPEWFRGATWEEPPLIIRTQSGAIHPEYSAVKLAIGFPP
jgi:tRNA1Val (adenine37-N6)-methyltransferase